MFVAKLENGNIIRAKTFGDMLAKAAEQNTRVLRYHWEE